MQDMMPLLVGILHNPTQHCVPTVNNVCAVYNFPLNKNMPWDYHSIKPHTWYSQWILEDRATAQPNQFIIFLCKLLISKILCSYSDDWGLFQGLWAILSQYSLLYMQYIHFHPKQQQTILSWWNHVTKYW